MIWLDGKFCKAMQVSLLAHSLHYGGAVYEGLRFYKTDSGVRAIFRLKDHLERLLASASVMGMEISYSVNDLMQVAVQAVQRSGLEEGYIRPMIYRGEGIGLMSANISVHTMIAILPWGKGQESITLTTSSFIRMHPGSTNIRAKVAGHYVNSYLAAAEARKSGVDDALLLDYKSNVAETSVANVFFVKGETVFTPARENIFPGITRDTVIVTLAAAGRIVEERNISLAEVLQSDAMFVVGTAAEVLPVVKLDGKEFNVNHPAVLRCRGIYQRAIRGGLLGAPDHWLTYVD